MEKCFLCSWACIPLSWLEHGVQYSWDPGSIPAVPRLPPVRGRGLMWWSGSQRLLPPCWWMRGASRAQNATKVMLEQSPAWHQSVLSLLQLWLPAALGQGHLLSFKSFHLAFAVSNFEASATGNGENSTRCLCSASCVQSSSQTLTN